MNASIVLTILGPDRTGLVREVADVVAAHGGSWQESRMARLAGQFAGILRIAYPAENQAALEEDLKSLDGSGLTVMIAHDVSAVPESGTTLDIEVTGLDEPGIVKRMASTLSKLGVNVEEWHTTLESAPMAGHLLFCTRGSIRVPEGLKPVDLISELESVGAGLTVDVQ